MLYEVITMAMIKVKARMDKEIKQSKMLLQVHDELVFDVHKTEVDQMRQLVQEEMENAVKLTVPLSVEVETGQNWLDAH